MAPRDSFHLCAERLFGRRGHENRCLPEIKDPASRASVLGGLVRLAYSYVRSEDDRSHEGIFTPNDRDEAERARNWLISRLLDAPGAETWQVVLDLTADPAFSTFSERLRLLARERAARDSEFEAYTPEDVVALEASFELRPNGRDRLFAVTIGRLGDLDHDIAHHDFTDRETLRTITQEHDMQRTLALRLDMMSRGIYRITGEEEVADSNRTDIRFLSMCGHHKALLR